LAITRQGFATAGAQESARLWRRLDEAHLALDRRIGQDPSAYQEAAILRETIAFPTSFPMLGPFTSNLLVTGIPQVTGIDIIQNAVIEPTLPPPGQSGPPGPAPPGPRPPPPAAFNQLAALGGGATPLFSAPISDEAIVSFRGTTGTVDRVQLQNGLVRQRGNADALEAQSFGFIGLERWTDGTYRNSANTTATLEPSQGLHVLYGTPPTNLPTNTIVTYADLRHATAPTIADGSVDPGTLNFAQMRIVFGPEVAGSRAGMDLEVRIDNTDHLITTNPEGGIANAATGPIVLEANGRFSSRGRTLFVFVGSEGGSSAACPNNDAACRASVQGFLANTGGDHAGFIYQFGQGPSTRVTGGAILRQGGID
jgi:hypothetical protein